MARQGIGAAYQTEGGESSQRPSSTPPPDLTCTGLYRQVWPSPWTRSWSREDVEGQPRTFCSDTVVLASLDNVTLRVGNDCGGDNLRVFALHHSPTLMHVRLKRDDRLRYLRRSYAVSIQSTPEGGGWRFRSGLSAIQSLWSEMMLDVVIV